MRRILLCLIILFGGTAKAQWRLGISAPADNINFGTAYTDQTFSAFVLLTDSGKYFTQDTIRLSIAGDGFSLKDTVLLWNSFKSADSFLVFFKPRHNILHKGFVLINSKHFGTISINLTGSGRYRDPYYNTTNGLSGNNLKQALKTIISANYVSLGYNLARDSMFMSIDNKKFNGEGASANTLECVYTGRLIIGYTSRAEAQNMPHNFNTEHTWPQSQFGQAEPMRSDLHHLFPTDNPANGVRADFPFGYVSNPTWSQGGSKGVNGLFEPRDKHKGRTARAMFYFALRYQNYDSFLNSQESTLRTWALQFPPDSVERRRNDAIFRNQKNRNPFVDHPEFLERIKYIYKLDPDTLPDSTAVVYPDKMHNFVFAWLDDRYKSFITVTNNGNTPVKIDSLSLRIVGVNYRNSTGFPAEVIIRDSLIEPRTSATIELHLHPHYQTPMDDSIYVYGSSFRKAIPIQVAYFYESIEEKESPNFLLLPNPASSYFSVKSSHSEPFVGISILNSVGQILLCNDLISSPDEINIAELPAGLYFVILKTANGKLYSEKLIKH